MQNSEDHDGDHAPSDLNEPTVTPAGPTRRRPSGPVLIAVVAVAVVAIAVGTTIALAGGGDPVGTTPGAQQQTTGQADQDPGYEGPGYEGPADPSTKLPNPDMPLVGPDGSPMVDGMVTAGPLFEEGARLLRELIAVVPVGYTVPDEDATIFRPDMSQEPTPEDYRAERSHQTRWLMKAGGVDVWTTETTLAVSAGPNTGMLGLTLHTPGAPEMEGTCAQLDADPEGECQLVDVGGREVMVLGLSADALSMQRARYTHPDGTTVSIMQTLNSLGDGTNPLPRHVFSTQELAALVVDDRFHQA